MLDWLLTMAMVREHRGQPLGMVGTVGTVGRGQIGRQRPLSLVIPAVRSPNARCQGLPAQEACCAGSIGQD